MNTVFQVADYFLNEAFKLEEDFLLDKNFEPELLCDSKLHLLVYYAQGFHLARFDQPLFDEPLEAWGGGPGSPSIYNVGSKYKINPNREKPRPDFDSSVFSTEQAELLDEIYVKYGQFSLWKLRRLSCRTAPWQNSTPFRNKGRGLVIPHEEIKEYFKTQLTEK